MKYIPGLNGIRAIAVLIVILYHWELPSTLSFLKSLLPNGNFGVNLFFVLSGFLITSILLLQKIQVEMGELTTKKLIANFYARRFLRIFPIYYLTIFLLYFTELPQFRENFIYYFTYTENFNVYFNHAWDSFSHTWSLAVEEQFYLIWPFVIIFTRKSLMPYILGFFIVLGPAFSIFQTVALRPQLNAFILPPSCFDAFGVGALVAYFYVTDNLLVPSKWIKLLLPFSVAMFVYWKLAPAGGHFQYFKRLSESIIGAGLIMLCLSQRHTRFRDLILDNKLFFNLGMVSYGLYLFHYTIPYFYPFLKTYFVRSLGTHDDLVDYLLMFVLLFVLAFGSYFFIEKPILRLKTRFK